jgi:small subunit ribosomal protein S16
VGAFDARTRRDGQPIEYLGSYDPHQEKPEDKLQVNKDRVEYWLSKGAQPSETVAKLLKVQGIGV